jgi:hypothetical protein
LLRYIVCREGGTGLIDAAMIFIKDYGAAPASLQSLLPRATRRAVCSKVALCDERLVSCFRTRRDVCDPVRNRGK